MEISENYFYLKVSISKSQGMQLNSRISFLCDCQISLRDNISYVHPCIHEAVKWREL